MTNFYIKAQRYITEQKNIKFISYCQLDIMQYYFSFLHLWWCSASLLGICFEVFKTLVFADSIPQLNRRTLHPRIVNIRVKPGMLQPGGSQIAGWFSDWTTINSYNLQSGWMQNKEDHSEVLKQHSNHKLKLKEITQKF